MAYGVDKKFPTFRQFLNMKFYANCKECKYFIDSDCAVKDKVIDDHGEESYQMWVGSPEKKNECLLFQK